MWVCESRLSGEHASPGSSPGLDRCVGRAGVQTQEGLSVPHSPPASLSELFCLMMYTRWRPPGLQVPLAVSVHHWAWLPVPAASIALSRRSAVPSQRSCSLCPPVARGLCSGAPSPLCQAPTSPSRHHVAMASRHSSPHFEIQPHPLLAAPIVYNSMEMQSSHCLIGQLSFKAAVLWI